MILSALRPLFLIAPFIPQLIAEAGKTIMPSNPTIIEQLKDRQRRVFRIAQDPRRYGLTIKMISSEAGLGYDSVANYASGETAMPLSAFVALIGVLPDELLSLLLTDGRMVVQVPEGVDHDEACAGMQDYLATKAAAHREDSECGPAIGPGEDRALRAKLAVVRAA